MCYLNMSEPVISVCWKNHTSELLTIYNDLLKNNFLVDCTLSAEGQNLKAHRLVLSACSPYFHMLFHEETEKHPFVILLDATFETMKAVIDFMYQGVAQIPKRNLEAFLSLAQSLQIKGLNEITENCMNKKLCGSTTENIDDGPSKDYQDSCRNQSIDMDKDSLEMSSQQHHHHSVGYTNVHTDSSVPLETSSASRVEAQTASNVTPLQEPLECDNVFIETEISVKLEPLYADFSETNTLENKKSDEPTTGEFMSEVEVGSGVFHKQHLNQYSSCSGSSRGSAESSSVMPHPQLSRLCGRVYSEQNITNQPEPLLPLLLEPKREHMEDAGSGEQMDDQDVSENDTNEEIESTCFEENLDQCSSVAGYQSEQGETTQNGDRQKRWRWQGSTNAFPSTVQTYVRHNDHKPRLRCNDCLATFTTSRALRHHTQLHTGERPYRCHLCDKSYIQKISLVCHLRTHTGERPYRCNLCDKAFVQKGNLVYHLRTHTGERPYSCNACGRTFTRSHHLIVHKRTHCGGRPRHFWSGTSPHSSHAHAYGGAAI